MKRLIVKIALGLTLLLPLVGGGMLSASAATVNATHHMNIHMACVLPAPACW